MAGEEEGDHSKSGREGKDKQPVEESGRKEGQVKSEAYKCRIEMRKMLKHILDGYESDFFCSTITPLQVRHHCPTECYELHHHYGGNDGHYLLQYMYTFS